jgi:osmotically-inducible protein OsmY
MASAVAALGLLMLSGCSLAGRTVGTYVDDKALIAAVKLRVAGEHPSHLKRVNVDAYDGTIYLSGFVERPIEKSDAEIAARRTEGVRQVVNDIVVRGSKEVLAAAPHLRRDLRCDGRSPA